MLNEITPQNFWVITDFDRTISCWWDVTAFGVFWTSPSVDDKLKEARKWLYEYYYPIECDLSMPIEERTQHMIDWYQKAMQLFEDFLTEEQLNGTITHAIENMKIREWVSDFLEFLSNQDIPTIIFSAWITNIIEWVLDYHNIPHNWIHGNNLSFDWSWKCVWVTNTLPIHNENKVWSSLPLWLRQNFKDKTHLLIMWDSIGDVKMWPNDRQTHTIWFLLETQKTHEQVFREKFDHVIESDHSDNWFLAEISKRLM